MCSVLSHAPAQTAFENLALLGPSIVATLVLTSAIWTNGRDVYTPHAATGGITAAVQGSWLLVALAAKPRWRPIICGVAARWRVQVRGLIRRARVMKWAADAQCRPSLDPSAHSSYPLSYPLDKGAVASWALPPTPHPAIEIIIAVRLAPLTLVLLVLLGTFEYMMRSDSTGRSAPMNIFLAGLPVLFSFLFGVACPRTTRQEPRSWPFHVLHCLCVGGVAVIALGSCIRQAQRPQHFAHAVCITIPSGLMAAAFTTIAIRVGTGIDRDTWKQVRRVSTAVAKLHIFRILLLRHLVGPDPNFGYPPADAPFGYAILAGAATLAWQHYWTPAMRQQWSDALGMARLHTFNLSELPAPLLQLASQQMTTSGADAPQKQEAAASGGGSDTSRRERVLRNATEGSIHGGSISSGFASGEIDGCADAHAVLAWGVSRARMLCPS